MSKTYRAELPEYVAKVQGYRKSGGYGIHQDRRTKRNRTRRDQDARAIRESRDMSHA